MVSLPAGKPITARAQNPKKITLFFINSHCSPSGVEVSLPKSRAAYHWE